MAENREDRSREDLTEEASPHRVEEYRSKGMVAQSRELSSLIALLAAGVATYAMGPSISRQFMEFMQEVFRTDLSSRMDLNSMTMLRGYLAKGLKIGLSVGLPICGAGFILGVIGSLIQVGAIFSFDPIQPDFQKINPLSGIRRLVSMRQFYEALRLIFKMVVVLAVSYAFVKSEILTAPRHYGAEAGYLLGTYGLIGRNIFFALIAVLALFAGVDLAVQRFEFSKNLRMTKQEAKQEHKEREGDPQIRARIRAVQREMARRRMMQAVKKADVIVTNPTHIAVAIVYDRAKMNAPKVVAKGADYLAQKIKQVATEAGVPLVENVPLARTLYKSVRIGHVIPHALYQAVAEVLAYVYRLKKRNV